MVKVKKWTASIIALTMLAAALGAVSSCDSSNPGGGGEDKYGRYDQEVKFTTVRSAEANPKIPEGMDLTNNPYTEYIKKELNVTYEFLWEDSLYNDRLLLDMTTGTLPDVFMVNDYTTYQHLYASDMLADLTDAYDEYASEEMKAIYASYGDRIFQPVTENGRLMALPSAIGGFQQELLFVRKDWLDALDLEPPKTIEEIERVARAFVEQDPGGNGKGNTIGINIHREHSFNGYRNSYGLETLASAMGAFPRQWMKNDKGEVYYGTIAPEFKQVLAKVREWVDIGVVDKNCFEQGWETIWGNVTSGKAGMWFFPMSWGYTAIDFIKNNPRAEVICYPAPLDKNGKATYFTGCPFEGMLVVRKGYEHPEVIFKVYDVWKDMMTGVHKEGYDALAPVRDSGTYWYYISPFGTYDCRYYDLIPRSAKELHDYVDNGVAPELFTDATKKNYEKVKSWIQNKDTPDNWAEWMTRYISSNVVNTPECNPIDPVYFFQTPGMVDNWDYLVTLENDMIRTIMNGEESIDYFDQFVLDWKAAGGDAITAEVAAAVN